MADQLSLILKIGPIYAGDGSSVWDELGQRTVARLIIRLCINTGKQTARNRIIRYDGCVIIIKSKSS